MSKFFKTDTVLIGTYLTKRPGTKWKRCAWTVVWTTQMLEQLAPGDRTADLHYKHKKPRMTLHLEWTGIDPGGQTLLQPLRPIQRTLPFEGMCRLSLKRKEADGAKCKQTGRMTDRRCFCINLMKGADILS